jgi:ATP-dependent DNA helicase DinG
MEENEYGNPILYWCPKEIAEIGKKLFFQPDCRKIIFTSATLTSDPGFTGYRYFGESIGFPMKGLLYEPKESPFDYENHTAVYIAKEMPHPSHRKEYLENSLAKIKELVELTKGKTMILFTSKTDMMYVKRHLETKYPVYIQSGKKTEMINQFKNEPDSILLGTNLWEGVNIAGDTLSQVIIFKLPFPVPDPIIDYKSGKTKNPMYDVLFPEMMIKLKQGCGRLIRNETDKGLISILDPRLSEENGAYYREEVLKSLPYKHVIYNMDRVVDWVNKTL